MLISFVIPTLNFAAFLPETLDSIVDEGFTAIEIIVFDGGSSDNTLEVLELYRKKWPELKVVSATERGNIDIDMNKAVTEATGDYVWTMSADDTLVPGWSKEIGNLLRDRPDLILVPAIHCDIAMRPRRDYPILKAPGGPPLKMTLSDDDDVFGYLDLVRTSEGVFSFCSACIVQRERLLKVPVLEEANGTCWRYSARLIAVLTSYPSTITVLGIPYIFKRGDNDSFSQAGLVRRLKIATINWDDAIGCLGLNTRLSKRISSFAKADIRPFTLFYFSQFVRDREERLIYRACVTSRLGNESESMKSLASLLEKVPPFAPLRAMLRASKALVRMVQQRIWSKKLSAMAQS